MAMLDMKQFVPPSLQRQSPLNLPTLSIDLHLNTFEVTCGSYHILLRKLHLSGDPNN